MIDFHSHILPNIDDGSQSLEESLTLLEMLRQQKVELVCATPHFYVENTTPERFLEKRNAAFSRVVAARPSGFPMIRLGAEVRYFSGISRMQELPKLRLHGTKILLLEMPFTRWSEYMLQELSDLSCSSEMIILLAHIERYIDYQRSGTIESLLQQGLYIQSNASFFIERKTQRKALKMLKNGQIHVIGSDCHNTSARPPRISGFETVIRKKLGDAYYEDFSKSCRSFMEEMR